MREKYDLSVLLNGINTEEQNNETIKTIEKLINKFDGKVICLHEPLKRRLAYVIKKVRNGVYINLHFEIDTKKVTELNKELLLAPEILRFQILKFIPIKKVIKKSKPIKTEIEEDSPDVRSGSRLDVGKKTSNKKENKKIDIDIEDLNKKLDELLDTKVIN